jgi:hypothetical protein
MKHASIREVGGNVLWQSVIEYGAVDITPIIHDEHLGAKTLNRVKPVFFDFTALLGRYGVSLESAREALQHQIDGDFRTVISRHKTVLEDPQKIPGVRRRLRSLEVRQAIPVFPRLYQDTRKLVSAVYPEYGVSGLPYGDEPFDVFATPSGNSRFDVHKDGNYPNCVINLSDEGVKGMTVLGQDSILDLPEDDRFEALLSGAGSLAVMMDPGIGVILDVHDTVHVGACLSPEGEGIRASLDLNFFLVGTNPDHSVSTIYS